MRLRTLKSLCLIVSRGSLSAAAKDLNVSEAALSRQVSNFEKSLGLKLFTRSGRTMAPTAECLEFIMRVEPAISDLENIDSIVSDIKGLVSERLRLSVMPRLSSTIVVPALSRLLNEVPAFTISLQVEGRNQILRNVVNRSCDLAVGSLPMHHANISTDPLFNVPTVVAVPKSHRLADRKLVNLWELRNETLILLPPNTMIGTRVQQMLDEAGLAPKARIRVSSVEDCCSFVARGHGVAIVDALLPAWMTNYVCAIPVDGAPQSRFGLIWRSDQKEEPNAARLKMLIKDEIRRTFG